MVETAEPIGPTLSMLFLSLSMSSLFWYTLNPVLSSLSCFVPFILSCPIYYGFCSLFCLVLSVMFFSSFSFLSSFSVLSSLQWIILFFLPFLFILSCPLCMFYILFFLPFLFILYCPLCNVLSSLSFQSSFFCLVLSVMFYPLFPSFSPYSILSSL